MSVLPSTNGGFWLYEWLDNLGITSYSQAEKFLKDPVAIADLRRRASGVPYTLEPLPERDDPTIVAGSAADLSGHLSCLAWECLKNEVDALFMRVWHFFDRVVVVGPSAHEISESETSFQSRHLAEFVRLLLYLREIGAADMLVFRQKPPSCKVHLRKHLEDVGAEELLELAEKLVPQLAEEALIRMRGSGQSIEYRFDHPAFEHTIWGSVKAGSGSDVRADIARTILKGRLAGLASDLLTAQRLNLPLGTTVRIHDTLLRDVPHQFDAPEIAFYLDIPVLDGLDARTLLRLREEQKPSFDRFRRSLAAAIQERATAREDVDPKLIAKRVVREVIDPAIDEMRTRLSSAKVALAKKAAATLTLTSLPTIYGIHSNTPLLIAAGVGPALQSTVTAVQKYIDDKREVSHSALYFLWNAQQHALHAHS